MSLYKGNNLISGHQVLYSTTGQNTDGAMTQKAVSDITENTRFDGQWTPTSVVLTTATAVDTYTIDVSNMLPVDNYSYECIVSVDVSTSNNTAVNIGSDMLTQAIAIGQNRGGASGVPTTYFRGNAILPVGTGRQIIVAITGADPIRNNTYLLGYRRIGTNS